MSRLHWREKIIGNSVKIRNSTHYCNLDEISVRTFSPLMQIGKVGKSRRKRSQETCQIPAVTHISLGRKIGLKTYFLHNMKEEITMQKTTVIGYPRVGSLRELKFWTEDYFKGKITAGILQKNAAELRKAQWQIQKQNGIDFIPSNDFSFYDGVLDTAFLFNAIPLKFKNLQLSELDTYFAMARGYQGDKGDVKAFTMRKWFNTNYHYMVPELEDDMEIRLNGNAPFQLYSEAKELGIMTKPVLIGPFTFLMLADFKGKKRRADFARDFIGAYREAFERFNALGCEWVQMDEPALVTDLSAEDIILFTALYSKLLSHKGNLKVLLQTYFGDIRDAFNEACALDFDGIGLDFVEGKYTKELIRTHGFPKDTLLFAGVVNGKNIWRNNYEKTLPLLHELNDFVPRENIVMGTSCSLLHVPYTLQSETAMDESNKRHFAFAQEKLQELNVLSSLFTDPHWAQTKEYMENVTLIQSKCTHVDPAVRSRTAALNEDDFTRLPTFAQREKIQKEALGLPPLPTTTIGSFPQTADIKALRAKLRKGEISKGKYKQRVKEKIADCIDLQEEIGLDVLVHGEYERNDMVEYFGENLDGFLFTQNAWVQSYGTRCVKPPIILGDVRRTRQITVEYIAYAQRLTKKPVKGMLTGPVTILNWSFAREDISNREIALQIALALKEEVADLAAQGIRIIQIDEAALKEKLPLRRADWHSDYLDWAISAFRLVHSSVNPSTQIHTHMCYSEFEEIVREIDEMDADVISFEAARSHLSIVDALVRANFKTHVGPGVYDIHSPRVPGVDEMRDTITAIMKKIDVSKLWVNPDCGLKTRGEIEAIASLKNMVAAAKDVRNTH